MQQEKGNYVQKLIMIYNIQNSEFQETLAEQLEKNPTSLEKLLQAHDHLAQTTTGNQIIERLNDLHEVFLPDGENEDLKANLSRLAIDYYEMNQYQMFEIRNFLEKMTENCGCLAVKKSFNQCDYQLAWQNQNDQINHFSYGFDGTNEILSIQDGKIHKSFNFTSYQVKDYNSQTISNITEKDLLLVLKYIDAAIAKAYEIIFNQSIEEKKIKGFLR